ncbi:MAG TPA: DUF2007 domain-containing protein [Bacteroidales bacterium]|nr:DUF2007 domain-containing protein [Bacteroidales bacterium]
MKKENLVKVFGGKEALALLLKGRLYEIGVESIIKNDAMDAFLGTSPGTVDLYIAGADIEKAKDIIQDVIDNM